MVLLDHKASSFAELFKLVVDTVRKHTDERRKDKDPADRYDQSDDPVGPAIVSTHCPCVHRPHQASPGTFDKAHRLLSFPGDLKHKQDKPGNKHHHKGSDPEPQDERRSSFAHGIVKFITELLRE